MDEANEPGPNVLEPVRLAMATATVESYTEKELSALLRCGERWLRYQRQRGLPPPFFKPAGSDLIRYRRAAIAQWQADEEARSMAEARAAWEAKNGPTHKPAPKRVGGKGGISDLGDSEGHGLDEPEVRRGRARKTATFAQFLSGPLEPADDLWLIALRGPTQQPQDYLGGLAKGRGLDEGDSLEWLTRAGYYTADAQHHRASGDHPHWEILEDATRPDTWARTAEGTLAGHLWTVEEPTHKQASPWVGTLSEALREPWSSEAVRQPFAQALLDVLTHTRNELDELKAEQRQRDLLAALDGNDDQTDGSTQPRRRM